MRSMNRLLLVLLLTATPLGVSWAEPPPWAPAHGYRAKHHYVYYPEREVYYAPDSGSWFWLDGGDWQVGVTLPVSLQPFVRVGVNLDLESDRPYYEHRQVVDYYGKGKAYGGGKSKGNDKGYSGKKDGDNGKGNGKSNGKGKGKD